MRLTLVAAASLLACLAAHASPSAVMEQARIEPAWSLAAQPPGARAAADESWAQRSAPPAVRVSTESAPADALPQSDRALMLAGLAVIGLLLSRRNGR